jgi:hypothetical protein
VYKGLIIDKNLIKYRVHDNQVCGIGKYNKNNLTHSLERNIELTKKSPYIKKVKPYLIISKQLKDNVLFDEDIKKYLNEGIEHLITRDLIHNNSRWRRFYYISKEILNGHYKKYSNGLRGIIRDILF